ncbi:MAG: hypothetical protein R2761_29870 [Acidimicrobiales bacterium]
MADTSERQAFHELTTEVHGRPLGQRLKIGALVMVALAVLTVIEYVIAVEVEHPLLPLLPFAALKFVLILEYFMHFTAVLGRGDH